MGPFDALARRRPEKHFPALVEAAVLLSLEKVIIFPGSHGVDRKNVYALHGESGSIRTSCNRGDGCGGGGTSHGRYLSAHASSSPAGVTIPRAGL